MSQTKSTPAAQRARTAEVLSLLKVAADAARKASGGPSKRAAVLRPVRVTSAALRGHFQRGLVIAAGLEPALTPTPPPPVLWSDGQSRLLVHLGRSRIALGDGHIDVLLSVECDQTDRTDVVCTFVTPRPERLGGFAFATEDAPRGPEAVVAVWGEALIALSWRALVEVARIVAGGAGVDAYERPFVPAAVVASPGALYVLPMPTHTFVPAGGSAP